VDASPATHLAVRRHNSAAEEESVAVGAVVPDESRGRKSCARCATSQWLLEGGSGEARNRFVQAGVRSSRCKCTAGVPQSTTAFARASQTFAVLSASNTSPEDNLYVTDHCSVMELTL
jgi:hypothetical protein